MNYIWDNRSELVLSKKAVPNSRIKTTRVILSMTDRTLPKDKHSPTPDCHQKPKPKRAAIVPQTGGSNLIGREREELEKPSSLYAGRTVIAKVTKCLRPCPRSGDYYISTLTGLQVILCLCKCHEGSAI